MEEKKNGLKKKKFIVMAVTTQVFTVDLFDDYCDECYGLEGYAVGRVRKDSVINGENIVAGDVLIGLPSSGFSLVTRSCNQLDF